MKIIEKLSEDSDIQEEIQEIARVKRVETSKNKNKQMGPNES